ncbi:MAG: ribbon-helix-helix protein, CopG family [Thermoleophilia bacterium]|nr:ribbon-helix-helix protein, CopG family [Thermoleophilia bacterium]
MRTTIRIDDALYRSVRLRAAQTGRTIGGVIEDALRTVLADSPASAPDIRPLPVFGGSGVMPGVDLADNRRLTDLLDDDTPLVALR